MNLTVKLDDVEKALDEAAMQIAVATGATPEDAKAALIAVSVGDQLLEPEPLPMSTAGTFAAARGGVERMCVMNKNLDTVEQRIAAIGMAAEERAAAEEKRAALGPVPPASTPKPLPISTADTFAAAYEAVTGDPYRGGMNRAERRRWMKRHLSRRGRQLVKRAREGG